MCDWCSFVLTASRVYTLDSDSHREIIDHYGLRTETARGVSILSVELTPPEDGDWLDLSQWRYSVYQDLLPDWLRGDEEIRAREALEVRSRTPKWRGRVARSAPDLTPEQRLVLARESTPEWRGQVACSAPGLAPKQRLALARESTPEWRGRVACSAPGLAPEQRVALARESTPEWRGEIAYCAPDLTPEQRKELRGR